MKKKKKIKKNNTPLIAHSTKKVSMDYLQNLKRLLRTLYVQNLQKLPLLCIICNTHRGIMYKSHVKPFMGSRFNVKTKTEISKLTISYINSIKQLHKMYINYYQKTTN